MARAIGTVLAAYGLILIARGWSRWNRCGLCGARRPRRRMTPHHHRRHAETRAPVDRGLQHTHECPVAMHTWTCWALPCFRSETAACPMASEESEWGPGIG